MSHQSDIADALTRPDRPAPTGLSGPAATPAGKRFDVYRNNVAVSLTEAVISSFPVITCILGSENMQGLARIYAGAYPPRSPVLSQYGRRFPEFLADFPALAHLGYLPDIARLELAMRRSYHAADSQPADPAQFTTIPAGDLGNCRLALAPSLELVRSPWPIHDIWRFNMEPGCDKPRNLAQDVLILRPQFDPQPYLLPKGGADWIAALSQGATMAESLVRAQSTVEDFDPTESLTLLLNGGAIITITNLGAHA